MLSGKLSKLLFWMLTTTAFRAVNCRDVRETMSPKVVKGKFFAAHHEGVFPPLVNETEIQISTWLFFFLHSRCLHVMCVHCLWAALSSPLARERFQKPGNTRKRPVAINAISNETGIGARARCGRNYGTFPMGVRRVAMLGMGAKFVFHSPHRNGVLCLPSNLHRALRADTIIPLNIPARNTDSIQ